MPSQLIDHAGRRIRVKASLEYRAIDPYAVTLTIRYSAGAGTDWLFARELMIFGLNRPGGAGDVVVAPRPNAAQGALLVGLPNGANDAVIESSRRSVARFLLRTYRVVPSGHEDDFLHIDWLILQLRSSAAGGDVLNAEA